MSSYRQNKSWGKISFPLFTSSLAVSMVCGNIGRRYKRIQLLQAYKAELNPTPDQRVKMGQAMGVCRFLYNHYVAMNLDRHRAGKSFVSGYDFDKYVHHEWALELPWVKQTCGSKARKKAIMNAYTAFKRYFQGIAKRPRFKKKQQQRVGGYFPKNNVTDLTVERHRIKVPTIGWIRLKEYGYLPPHAKVTSCTCTQRADRYYISVFVDVPEDNTSDATDTGIGVDLGIKGFAFTDDGTEFSKVNRTSSVRKLEKRLKRAQRSLSRKYESKKKRGEKSAAEGGNNIRKNVLRVQKLHGKLARIRDAYRAYVVRMLVKTKPAYITMEDLNGKGMMTNRHLSKAIAKQGFYDFTHKLIRACKRFGIELRQVSRFYPSSKSCSCCGHKKVQLSLSERIYPCESCGTQLDRDHNAARNLQQAKEYVVFT